MTKTQQLRSDVQALQDKVRVQLLEAANSCSEAILDVLPGAGEAFTPQIYATIRWEMLKAGFSHSEIAGITSKLKCRPQPVKTPEEWIHVVTVDYLAPIAEDTDTFDLYIYQGTYQDRLAGKILNAHEKLCFLTAKRINEFLETRDLEKRPQIIKRFAVEWGMTEEMVWRVATGGTRVPASLLDKVNRSLRRIDSFIEDHNG